MTIFKNKKRRGGKDMAGSIYKSRRGGIFSCHILEYYI